MSLRSKRRISFGKRKTVGRLRRIRGVARMVPDREGLRVERVSTARAITCGLFPTACRPLRAAIFGRDEGKGMPSGRDLTGGRRSAGTTKKNAFCSFCRKSYRDVGPLVEGPGDVYICGECIELCSRSSTKATPPRYGQAALQPHSAPARNHEQARRIRRRARPSQEGAFRRGAYALQGACKSARKGARQAMSKLISRTS